MSILGAYIFPHPPLILPQIGKGEERKIAATVGACETLARRIAVHRPETIVLISPHATVYADYFHISPGTEAAGEMARFRCPEVRIRASYDSRLASAISEEAQGLGVSAGTLGEREPSLDHGTMIPLWFVNKYYADYKLVRIGLSGLSPLQHYRLGKGIAQASEALGRGVVVIASGDLSHKLKPDGPYGFAPQGPEFDERVTAAMERADFLSMMEFDEAFCDAAAECGLRSFQIMAGALDGKLVLPSLLSYEGSFGVGYGVAGFEIAGDSEERRFDVEYERRQREKLDIFRMCEDEYTALARKSLEYFVKTGERLTLNARDTSALPPDMLSRRAGVFVSLKKQGRLRGCIGTIQPTCGSIAEEIVRNAVEACSEDPRFDPVTEEELDELVYSVDVLSDAEPCVESQLDVKRYGVIVSSGRRRGLLLPNLDGVDSVEQQISIAKQKAGIRAGERCDLQRFEVVRHK